MLLTGRRGPRTKVKTIVEEMYDYGQSAEFPDTVILHQGLALSPRPVISRGRYVM